ncbi:MAG: pyridoxal-phosphate dependent enzyme [Planctomycetaceae bacterium]
MSSTAPSSTATFCVSLAEIRQAAERIRPHVLMTPVVEAWQLHQELGCRLSLKCENLQYGFAFKARGACNAVFSLSDEDAARGVVTHSSGNHAAALARAAVLRGLTAHIVMPHNSARVKLEAVRSLGVEPILCEPDSASREATAAAVQQRTGATMIHPFNDARVIAGQGTAALEILRQVPDVDTIIVPVGGGGLLAGTLLAVKSIRPDIRVFAAEPAWADDAFRSLKSGTIEPALRTDTIADGLRTPLGPLTFPVIQRFVDEVLCVDESTILRATAMLAWRCRLIAEPSGAVPLGALLQHNRLFTGSKTVALISGGNLDNGRLLID